jgi:DNA-binding transcriptional LysR family regulator
MDLKHLRAFVTVAEELHFGRAADKLGIAQPPLSLQIQALEAGLGVRLFERNRRRVALTDAGRQFLPEARATLAQAERAWASARRAARGELGRLEIGFTGSAPFNAAMPRIISGVRRRWPDLQLSLREMSTSAQFRALTDGSLDIGFVRPGRSEEAPGIALRVILREALWVVLPADHPLAEQERIRLAELADQSFILHPRQIGTGLYDKVTGLCRAAGFAPQVVLEAHQMSTIVSLAAAGVGISIVPEAMRRLQVEGARFVAIADPGADMVLSIACRQDDSRPAVHHVLDEAQL